MIAIPFSFNWRSEKSHWNWQFQWDFLQRNCTDALGSDSGSRLAANNNNTVFWHPKSALAKLALLMIELALGRDRPKRYIIYS